MITVPAGVRIYLACGATDTHLMEDHIKLFRSTAPVTTHLVDTPFDRVGYPQFSLKTLADA